MKEELYDNGFFVVDNFVDEEICKKLRKYALEFNHFDDVYPGYRALNYYAYWECRNKNVDNLVRNILPNILTRKYPFLCEKKNDYQRGWYVVHDSTQIQTITRHSDPGGYITANLWVTPDEYKEDDSADYNGFIIHTSKGSVTIPYRYNRLTVFFSELEHESKPSRFQIGNEKVNYTFLFGKPHL